MTPKPFDYLGKARQLRAKLGREKNVAHTPTLLLPSPNPNGNGYSEATGVVRRSLEYKAAKQCELITDSRRLAELATSLRSFDEVAVDTETYPQDGTNSALDPRRARVRLISVAVCGGVGGVVDVREVDPGPLLDVLREKTLVFHNALFDLGFLLEMGFELGEGGEVIDTMLMSQILEDKDSEKYKDAA